MVINHQSLIKLAIAMVSIYAYCTVVRRFILSKAYIIARHLKFTRSYPLSAVKDIVGSIFITFSLVLFCALLLFILKMQPSQLGLFHWDPIMIFYGLLVGVGEAGVALLIYQTVMSGIKTLFPNVAATTCRVRFNINSNGWPHHNKRFMQITSLSMLLLMILIQAGAQEIIFRGVMIHYFSPYGGGVAIAISTLLFILMVALLYPMNTNTMFTSVAALVIGVVHGILYLNSATLLPLIVAHVTLVTLLLL